MRGRKRGKGREGGRGRGREGGRGRGREVKGEREGER